MPWHRIRTFDGKHKAPEFVSEAESIEIVAVTADWWALECRQHGSGRAWRIPGVAYAEERKFSVAQWVADEKRAGTWPW